MSNVVVKVSDVMQAPVHIIDALASVRTAVTEMNRHGVSSLLIERRQAGDEYGVITVHDIAGEVIGKNRSTNRTSVYEVMTKPALTVHAGMNVKYAIRILCRFNINRALVLRDDELVGLVTLRDMVVGYVRATEPKE
jgi:signal-transduction protein with cAMP-binding, CBS, and nucleotidyltransferase domain